MDAQELENYFADIVGILAIARTITREEALQKDSAIYRLLAHLLERYLSDSIALADYIKFITDDDRPIIERLNNTKQSVQEQEYQEPHV
jgi:hypothetical protein